MSENENAGHDVMGSADILTDMRAILRDYEGRGETVTYQNLATTLGLVPPNTIHQVTTVLENLMADDVAHDRPMIAAMVVRKGAVGMPARGFFDKAAELGRFEGDPMGDAAEAFYRAEFAVAAKYWAKET